MMRTIRNRVLLLLLGLMLSWTSSSLHAAISATETTQAANGDPHSGTIAAVNNDLLETVGSVASSASFTGSGPASLLTNSQIDTDTTADMFKAGDGEHVEFDLDTTVNTGGYDITNITTISHWTDSRAGQAYTVSVRSVGSSSFAALYTHNGADVGNVVNRTALTDDGGTLATGIDGIRFDFADCPIGWNWTAYREIDVMGVANAGSGVLLDGDAATDTISTNAAPGTLVGNLSMANTNGTFAYSLKTSGDYTYFDIPTGTTNLRTAAWIDSDSYSISIIGTESGGGGLVLTNDFTITVDPANDDMPDFIVSADVQAGTTDGAIVGTAHTLQSGATLSISGGREDLFYFDGADLKTTNSADWGSVGTTNYVTLQAVVGTGTNELIVAAAVVSGTTSGTIFKFR